MGYIFDALNKAGQQPSPDDPKWKDTDRDESADRPQRTLRLDDILAKHTPPPVTVDGQPGVIASAMSGEPAFEDQSTGFDAPVIEPSGFDEPADYPAVATVKEHEPALAAAEAEDGQDDPLSPFRLPGVVNSTPAVRKWYQFWKRPGTVPFDDRLVVLTSAASSMAEEYRSTRTSILARHQNERHLVHTITSATPQEGKTITCMNLGLAFAELRNRKTIVVECDLRLPTFEKLLQLEQPTGLISYLHGDASLSQIITQVPGTGLDVITAGGRVSDEAVQMLSSSRMSQLIQSLRAKYDHVIIDTPPVVDLADAGILGAQGDEVLLVARMRRTPQPLVEQAIRTLNSYNAQVAGVIATDNPRTRGRGYGYRYGYGYGYRYTYSGKRRGRRHAA